MKVQHVLDAVWDMAPRELAEEWDNVGLLAGHPENEVTKVLCALDLTSAVIDEAIAGGAQAFITGEIGYHIAMSAVDEGLCILEAGHDGTERVAVKAMANGLQNRLNALQYNVTVLESTAHL